MASPPGSKEYGILSVLYALFAEPVVALRFPPESLLPPPKVDSAILRARFDGPRRPDVAPLDALRAVSSEGLRPTAENP